MLSNSMSDTRTSDMPVSDESSRSPRTIVLCFDGTRGQYDATNTNVVKFFGLLCKDYPDKQVAYYQAGVGTYFSPGVVSPLWNWLATLLDEAFAWYLDAHVMAGYEYLMDNYQDGDKICLFGFSRGAFTARALAGMLHKVGLLTKDNLQQVDFAYKAFKRTDKEGIKLAPGFKKTFSRDVKIEFVGVWDTVQSTGIIFNRILPFTDSNTAIRVFRHALSLDERRARFRPNLYHWPTQVDDPDDVASSEDTAARKFSAFRSNLKRLFNRRNPKAKTKQVVQSASSAGPARVGKNGDEVASDGTQPTTGFVHEESFACTDVMEVWFAGCHSDIGGGNVPDDVEVSLAQIPLHWMVEQVIQSQCGIIFNDDELVRLGITVPQHSPRTLDSNTDNRAPASPSVETAQQTVHSSGSAVQGMQKKPNGSVANPEAYPERPDAVAPLFDELKRNKLWWVIEVIPISYAWQDGNGVWHSKWRINLGRSRLIPFEGPKFHHTVKERMDSKQLKYEPRAIYDHNEVYV